MNAHRVAFALSSAALCLALAACSEPLSGRATDGAPAKRSAQASGPRAQDDDTHGRAEVSAAPSRELEGILAAIEGFERWPKFPENQRPNFSEGHGKVWVVAYLNDVVARAVDEGTLPLPDGALIVKTNAPSPEAESEALTIMSKRRGEWYWAKVNPDGRVAVEDGRALEGTDVAMCVACHSAKRDNDFIFTHSFR